MNQCDVSLVPPAMVPDVWNEVAPILNRALKTAGGRYRIDDLFMECFQGQQHLWVAMDNVKNIIGALTTRFIEYPGRRMLSGQFCAGVRMRDWQDEMLSTLDSWAKDGGCTGFEMTGRGGWERVLKNYGWRKIAVVYEKVIT
jgi:hypothetical protein